MRQFKHFFLIAFLFAGISAFAQTRTLKGKVVSGTNNQPVPGASVLVKGTTSGTATGVDGSFSFSVPAGDITLMISSLGFNASERNVSGTEDNITIVLTENKGGDLGEVVVTALGITRKTKSLVYATQTVKTSELTEVRDPNNVLNSLQGKVANAVISQGSGGPGSGARIVLRGNRSIQKSNNALIVVDGVPINNSTNGTAGSDFGSVNGSDGASNINPDDIESITVLRGASAAALYGSEAGNGVLVITTKKGKVDKLSVLVNSGVTAENAWSLPKVQDLYGQGNGGQIDASAGDSWGAKLDGQSYTNHLGNQASYTAQPDNIKDFFRTGISTNNSIGISGGTEKAQTYLSYTNNNIQGIVPGNTLMRHTLNFRISNQINKWLSTDAKITYINQDIKNKPRTGEENAPSIDIYQIPRNVSTADAEQYEYTNNVGIPAPTAWPSTLSSIYQNPYWLVNRSAINETRDRLIGFLSAKIKITPWLNLSGRINIDRTLESGESKYSQGTILWSTSGGSYSTYDLLITEKWLDAMLEGNNNITSDLKITYRVGGIYKDSKYNGSSINTNGLNVTNRFSLNFAKAPSVGSGSSQVQIQSVYGQVNLSWRDRIFLDASLRNDWDSRLPSPYTYQYPSVGVSAILSDMIELPAAISFLKASGNYAQVGNGGQFGLLKSTYSYSPGAGNGFLARGTTLPFPTLKPEIVKSIEFGIDARFVKNRIGFTATYYSGNSFNQLLTLALPPATGYSSQYINAGKIQNSGFELVVTGTPIKKKDFSWDVTLNFATNKTKIIELSDQIKSVPLGGGFARSATPVVEEGKSFGDLIAYKWQTDAKGNYLVTAAGKPLLTSDQQYIGNFNPKATLGFTNTFQYKAFSLRILMDGRVGGVLVSGTEMNLAFSGIPEGTSAYREGGWNLGGVDANGAPVSATISAQDFWQIASGKRYGAGEFFAYDATSFRMREVSIGYTLPIGTKSFIKSVRVSAIGRNLFWIVRGKSKMNIPGLEKRTMWFDPDMSLGNGNFQGVEYGTLPATRSLGLNLQVTF